jgi:hypothetical protein
MGNPGCTFPINFRILAQTCAMRKPLVLLFVFSALFSGCQFSVLGVSETNTPKKMAKTLRKNEIWEIQ